MASLRTKSGRLRAGEKRRRLKKLEPGAYILLDKRRASKLLKSGSRIKSKNAFEVDYAVAIEFMIDLDVRKLVEMVSLALADHFKQSLLAGVWADGRGPLPPLRDKSKDGTFGPRAGAFANKSGFLANNWGLLKITGSSVRASRKVKPNGADGRSQQINHWADRTIDPVDLQSVDGAAGRVIGNAINEWMKIMRGARVGTPKRANTKMGTLPQLQR